MFNGKKPEKLPEMTEYPVAKGPFKPEWDSLKQYTCPDWFRNAKFGIWAHWGPQAVSGAGDWYARNMYMEGHPQYQYHCEHYGHPSEFGYKDIVKLWKAEAFDADALIQLYKKAGARYFVALAVHHDNYDCWNSRYHRWNSVNIGPGKDIVGMWREAALKHGLAFGVTEHLARSYNWFNTNKGCDQKGPYAGVPYDGNDPEYVDFYFPPHEDTNHAYPVNPPESWKQLWYMRIKDLVETYQPDLLYTDGAVPFGEVGRTMIANFYNNNIAWHDGKLEAVYTLKDMRGHDRRSHLSHGEYVEGIGIQDMERGVVDDIRPEPWQTDTCIGGWYYNKFIEYKTAETVIHMLVDIVSKNGNLLLNFPLRPDGTLDEKAMKVVEGITQWMAINSEAIYDTRPWRIFGEGPVRSSGGLFNEDKLEYTSRDFRFTRRGDILYATCLAWSKDGRVRIESLGQGGNAERVMTVELLGCPSPVSWEQDADGLQIDLPEEKPCDYAWVFKIRLA